MFDVKRKGYILWADIWFVSEELGKKLSEKDCMKIHKNCNTRKDGRLTFDEFFAVYRQQKFKLSI